MENIFKFLTNNPWLNILFLLLAIFGIIMTLYTYLKSKKTSKPTFAKTDFKIITSNFSAIENLSVLYNNNPIEELSVSKIVIYNAGKKSIRKEDIAPKDKIRIDFLDGKILNSKIHYCTKEINNFSILKTEKSVLVDFDYLGYFDGAVIQIFHTAKNPESVKIEGTIIDSGNFKDFMEQFVIFRPMKLYLKFQQMRNLPSSFIILLIFPFFIIWIFPAFIYMLILKKRMPKEFILS